MIEPLIVLVGVIASKQFSTSRLRTRMRPACYVSPLSCHKFPSEQQDWNSWRFIAAFRAESAISVGLMNGKCLGRYFDPWPPCICGACL